MRIQHNLYNTSNIIIDVISCIVFYCKRSINKFATFNSLRDTNHVHTIFFINFLNPGFIFCAE